MDQPQEQFHKVHSQSIESLETSTVNVWRFAPARSRVWGFLSVYATRFEQGVYRSTVSRQQDGEGLSKLHLRYDFHSPLPCVTAKRDSLYGFREEDCIRRHRRLASRIHTSVFQKRPQHFFYQVFSTLCSSPYRLCRMRNIWRRKSGLTRIEVIGQRMSAPRRCTVQLWCGHWSTHQLVGRQV